VIETFHRYNAFIDESMQERHGLKVTSVGAYVGTFDRWLKFEEEWYGILKSFEIPLDGKPEHTLPFFHMTDFLARQKQFANDWSDNRRDQFMERLTMTISEHTIVGVSVSVNDAEFERVLPPDAHGFWREPYFFCVWGALQSLSIMERISRNLIGTS